MTSHIDGLYNTLSGAHRRRSLSIQASMPLGHASFKVVAAVTNVDNEEDLAQCLAQETDGAARLVRGSAVMRGRIVAAVVRANNRSVPLDARFRMVTSCTASDEQGNIWNVVSDGNGRRAIIQENADDLDGMLKQLLAHRSVVINPTEGRGVSTASFENGDLVRYVNTATESAECAFAFRTSNGVIGVNARAERCRIDPHAIMSSVAANRVHQDCAQLQREVAATNLTPEEMEAAIAFLGRCGILNDQMAERMRQLSSTPLAA